jgi:DNA-binding transcriptional ArsR family regulator
LAIINALATGEELTATQCAELTELSPSATAYHLKLLERYGFAEPAPQRTDRRERPWRTTAYFDTTRALGLAFAAGEHAEPEEWRNAVLSNADLWLTDEEVERVSHELEAVLEPLRGRALRAERPAGSRRVRVMNVVVPHPRTHPQPVPRRP